MHDDGAGHFPQIDDPTLTGDAGSPAVVETPDAVRRLALAELPSLACDLRRRLLETVSRTGGHLGGSLGVVELTIALHWVFDTPRDKLIWDVSHQCYPHKLLTGRGEAMRKLRQRGGAAGFTSRRESEFDPFGAAHSSTAISAAIGMAVARDLKNEAFDVVAVVGDGAMSGGMVYEALNNLGALKTAAIVVLNDNDMSIAPPVGSLAAHLTALRGAMPAASVRHAALLRGDLPSFAGQPTLFDNLGVRYAGPFDGHDLNELCEVFKLARAIDGPVLLHIVTEKGHGYEPAVRAADRYHAVAKFDVATGVQSKPAPAAPNYTRVFADALIDEARRDPAIVAVTAAMPSGTGLDRFGAVFPQRTFDVGIAEQHAVTFCAGLACEGMKPFATIYSTFLQRGYDQVVHDVAIQRLPVRFAIDRAGLVGADGVTHQGTYDIAYLGCLPGFVLMAAGDEAELVRMVATAVAIDDRPSALRYPRGDGVGLELPVRPQPLDVGRGRILRTGGTIALLSYGSRLPAVLAAADVLDGMGFGVTVADARFAKPVDDRLIATLLREHALVLTVEEGSIGGFATQVHDSIARQGLEALLPRLRVATLPDVFVDHDEPAMQLVTAELDAQGIVRRVLANLTRLSGNKATAARTALADIEGDREHHSLVVFDRQAPYPFSV